MGDLLDLFRVLVGKRFPFQFVFSNEYWMVETGKHVFPLQKYRLVYENLLAMGAKKENFLRPRPAPDGDLVPGGNTRRFAIQAFVDASGPGGGTTVMTRDAFLLRNDLEPLSFEALGNDQNIK